MTLVSVKRHICQPFRGCHVTIIFRMQTTVFLYLRCTTANSQYHIYIHIPRAGSVDIIGKRQELKTTLPMVTCISMNRPHGVVYIALQIFRTRKRTRICFIRGLCRGSRMWYILLNVAGVFPCISLQNHRCVHDMRGMVSGPEPCF